MINNTKNKRKFKRYKAKPGAYALIRPKCGKLGQILEISRKGLSFSYIENTDNIPNNPILDILFIHNEFYIDKILFTPVFDYILPKQFPTSMLNMRKQGLRFDNLSSSDKNKINYFIKKYTSCKV